MSFKTILLRRANNVVNIRYYTQASMFMCPLLFPNVFNSLLSKTFDSTNAIATTSISFSKNTPASANDVYKIALVHERSPHLTKREVQRKLFDGDISDRILNFPYWNQNASLPIANYEHQKEYELENYPENQVSFN